MTQASVDPAALGWRQHDIPGFSNLVGPFWARSEGEGWRYAFLAEDRHLNGQGVVHGGMLMTFIDQALGMVVREAIGRRPCATIQLNSQFVDAGRSGDFIEASCEVVRRTRSVVFMRGTLTAAGRIILSAEGLWKVLGV